jgi:iron complex transport system substrate-binding protein
MPSPTRAVVVTVLIILALVASACGSDGSDPASSAEATPTESPSTPTPDPAVSEPEPSSEPTGSGDDDAVFPVTVTAANGDVTVGARPERIVSLSPVATEILFAIGAGDRVVAVDSASDFPAEAPTTDLSGFDPNIESLAQFDPDLVVITFDPGELISGLDALGVPALLQPSALGLDDAYSQIEQLGAATGNLAEAAALVASMQSDMAELAAMVPERPQPLTYYFELDPTLYTVTTSTFAGEILALAGMESIADAADGAASGFPQLSEEFILDANPDVIVLADTVCCGQDAETVTARPGWAALSAVSAGRVVAIDDSLASRWGPRVVDFLAVVVDRTADLTVGAG